MAHNHIRLWLWYGLLSMVQLVWVRSSLSEMRFHCVQSWAETVSTYQPKQNASNTSPMRAALMCRVPQDVQEGVSLVLYNTPIGTDITWAPKNTTWKICSIIKSEGTAWKPMMILSASFIAVAYKKHNKNIVHSTDIVGYKARCTEWPLQESRSNNDLDRFQGHWPRSKSLVFKVTDQGQGHK